MGVSALVGKGKTFGVAEIVTVGADLELDILGEHAESKITKTTINRGLLFIAESFHS
jgi:hypothetical protein